MSALLQLCCNNHRVLHTRFNWKSVRLPPCPCLPRPPTCLPFRLRSRWSGRASGWPWFASALVLSASRPDLSRAPAVALLEIAEAARQDVRVSVGGQNRRTAARVATIILCFSLVFSGQRWKHQRWNSTSACPQVPFHFNHAFAELFGVLTSFEPFAVPLALSVNKKSTSCYDWTLHSPNLTLFSLLIAVFTCLVLQFTFVFHPLHSLFLHNTRALLILYNKHL